MLRSDAQAGAHDPRWGTGAEPERHRLRAPRAGAGGERKGSRARRFWARARGDARDLQQPKAGWWRPKRRRSGRRARASARRTGPARAWSVPRLPEARSWLRLPRQRALPQLRQGAHGLADAAAAIRCTRAGRVPGAPGCARRPRRFGRGGRLRRFRLTRAALVAIWRKGDTHPSLIWIDGRKDPLAWSLLDEAAPTP